ncbi:MAG: hypothetical protein E5W19_30655 [Mesorhizobium sp.]|nr:MAG: hypothetical protein E5W19_30655 [Mesorhizobium sp.]
MSGSNDLAVLIERWFTDRLMRHRGASSNTIASVNDPGIGTPYFNVATKSHTAYGPVPFIGNPQRGQLAGAQ